MIFDFFKGSNRLDVAIAYQNLQQDKSILVVDVRTPEEFQEGHIPHSINLPVEVLDQQALITLKDKGQTIYVYCYSGSRSRYAQTFLTKMGFTSVFDLGGIIGWPYEVVYD